MFVFWRNKLLDKLYCYIYIRSPLGILEATHKSVDNVPKIRLEGVIGLPTANMDARVGDSQSLALPTGLINLWRRSLVLTIAILLLSFIFNLPMEVSSAVATWSSLAVTIVGLGSIGTQVRVILDQANHLYSLRNIGHLGKWWYQQPDIPWHGVYKAPSCWAYGCQ
jgi:hypothetical protein